MAARLFRAALFGCIDAARDLGRCFAFNLATSGWVDAGAKVGQGENGKLVTRGNSKMTEQRPKTLELRRQLKSIREDLETEKYQAGSHHCSQ
jgi:hypothetical protein